MSQLTIDRPSPRRHERYNKRQSAFGAQYGRAWLKKVGTHRGFGADYGSGKSALMANMLVRPEIGARPGKRSGASAASQGRPAVLWPRPLDTSGLGQRAIGLVVTAATTQPRPAQARSSAILFAAAESLKSISLRPDAARIGETTTLLHRAAREEADRRPRHAAVALAAWDALRCTADPLESKARQQVVWEVAQALLSQFISTEAEMRLLDRMDTVGLDRIPPFEETIVGQWLETAGADEVR